MAWTAARIAEFKGMFDEEMSFGLIAAKMRMSRNALIGKAHRLGWPRRKVSPMQRIRAGKKRARNVLRQSFAPPVQPKPKLSTVPVAPTPPPPPEAISFKHIVGLMQLDDHTCRYPLWWDETPLNEQWFCGTPTANVLDGRPYCSAHSKVAYSPSRVRAPAIVPGMQAAE